MNENYLYHFGVKGMKWGVRRNRVSSAERKRIKSEAKGKIKSLKKTTKENNKLIGRETYGDTASTLKALNRDAYVQAKDNIKYEMKSKLGKINTKKIQNANQYHVGKQKTRMALGTIGVLGIGLVGGTAQYYYKNKRS